MLAKYKGCVYNAKVEDKQVTLLTYNQNKAEEGFKPKRDYFEKNVDLNDSCLREIFDIHFYVKYKDCVEEQDVWMVDENRAVGFKGNVENNEVVIDVAHDSKDVSWIQYEKGAAMKKINLLDCEEYIVEKKYIKKEGKVDEITEKFSIEFNVFRDVICMSRKSNF